MTDTPRQDAVKLRRYFQKVAQMETHTPQTSGSLEMRCHVSGGDDSGRVTDVFLAWINDGKIVAMAPITRKDFKRLKGDFEFLTGPLRSRSGQRDHAEW